MTSATSEPQAAQEPQVDLMATLSPAAKNWVAVFTQLGLFYPASKFAGMGRVQSVIMAGTWAKELRDIPADAVDELLGRLLRSERAQKSTFAPSIADFLAIWNEWDYYRELNTDEEANHPVGPMLPAAARVEDGPGRTAAVIQNRRFATGKGMVLCHCINPMTRNRLTATLSPDKSRWVCAGPDRQGALASAPPCNLSQALDPKDAELLPSPKEKPKTWADIKREQVRAAMGESNENANSSAAAVEVPASKPQGVTLEMFALHCGLDLEIQDAEQMHGITQFWQWCQKQTPVLRPTRATFDEIWNDWQFEAMAA